MQQRLKQRLIGAVVLVALAVIFLPMLLTGPVEQKRVDVPIEIPPKPTEASAPEVPAPGFAEQPVPAAEELAQAPRPVSEPTAQAEPGAAQPTTEPQPEPQSEPGPPVATAENASPVPESSAEAEAPQPEPSSPPAPAEEQVAAAAGSWVVQVGAFRGRDNALARRNALREAGYPAYVDQVNADGKPLYRVRLGPVVERSEAEAMAGKVKEEQGIPVLVVSR